MADSVARKSEFKYFDILKGIIGLSAGFSLQSVSAKTWQQDDSKIRRERE